MNIDTQTTAELSKGDLVRCRQAHAFNTYTSELHDDGWLYGWLQSTDPDNDNDLKVKFADETGDYSGSTGYFDADALEHTKSASFTPPWRENEPDDEILDRLESRDDEDALAMLQEEQENLVQLGEMRARTVEHGTLELDVKTVTSASNSEKWAIKVDHPVVGELTFYVDKPVMGWSDEYRIVELLREYGIADGNPYKLQQRMVYVEYVGGDHDVSSSWELRTPSEISEGSGDSSSSLSEYRPGVGREAFVHAVVACLMFTFATVTFAAGDLFFSAMGVVLMFVFAAASCEAAGFGGST